MSTEVSKSLSNYEIKKLSDDLHKHPQYYVGLLGGRYTDLAPDKESEARIFEHFAHEADLTDELYLLLRRLMMMYKVCEHDMPEGRVYWPVHAGPRLAAAFAALYRRMQDSPLWAKQPVIYER